MGVFFVVYFATLSTPVKTISTTIIAGQTCTSLNPKTGTVYFNATHSENAQFASLSMTSQKCEELLTRLNVCGDGRRLDVINLWGISNPNSSQYYPGGNGYFSFTPTQTS